MVWLFVNKQLKPVRLRLGTSDGTSTEVLDGSELQAGAEVVTAVTLPTTATPAAGAASGTSNPLMGPQRGGPGDAAAPGPAAAASKHNSFGFRLSESSAGL